MDEHWDLLEADLHERYGIDLWAPDVLDRPWPWLNKRIAGLLATPPTRLLIPTDSGFAIRAYPTTRIQAALAPDI